MTDGIQTILYPVDDITAAKARFTELLGVSPYMDQPYYCAFTIAGQDIGLDPQGHTKGMTGPTPYFHVDDIHAQVKTLLAAGAEPIQPIKDVGGGKLVASVKDPDGNMIGLIQPAP